MKNLIGKDKYTVKILSQTYTQLVERLKGKNIKTIYIHNKQVGNM